LTGTVDVEIAADAADLFDRCPRRVERAEVLIEVSLFEVRAAANLPAVFLGTLTGQQLEQRGFPGAVRSDDTDPVAATHQEIDPLEQLAAAPRSKKPFGIEHDVARTRRRGESKRDFFCHGPHVFRHARAVELFEHLAPALSLLRLLPCDVLADEVFRLVDERLLSFGQASFALQIRLARDGVIGVLEWIGAETGAPELHGGAGNAVQKCAIVGHDHDGPAVAGEVLLEPSDGVEIEVVGRLVEQQQIRFLRQHDAEMQTTALAA
jgi:hypothetical protein